LLNENYYIFLNLCVRVCVNCLFFNIQKRRVIEQTMHVLKRFTLYFMAHCKSIEQYRKKKRVKGNERNKNAQPSLVQSSYLIQITI